MTLTMDDPAILAEVTEAFHRYEAALLRHDVEQLDAMFLPSDRTVRYGVADVQHGIEQVRRWRATQGPFARRLSHTVITCLGRDVAVASTMFHRPDMPDQTGRQTQTWVRTAAGWQIVAAHVSMMDASIAAG